jgi:hypothetical protein
MEWDCARGRSWFVYSISVENTNAKCRCDASLWWGGWMEGDSGVVCGMKERKKAETGSGRKVAFDCSPRTKASLVGDEINLGFGP